MLPLLPTNEDPGNDKNLWKNARERINSILKFEHDDSRRRSDAEKIAGVYPVNYSYPPGHVYRYGTNSVPGTTDMGPALQVAINVMNTNGGGFVILPPASIASSIDIVGANGVSLVGESPWTSKIIYTGSGKCLDWYGVSRCTLANFAILTDQGGSTQAIRLYGNNNIIQSLFLDEATTNSGAGWSIGISIDGDTGLANSSSSNVVDDIYINHPRSIGVRVTRSIDTYLSKIRSFGAPDSTAVIHLDINTGASGVYMQGLSFGYGLNGVLIRTNISTSTGPLNFSPRYIFPDNVLCDTITGGDGWKFDSTLGGNVVQVSSDGKVWAAGCGLNAAGTVTTTTANGIGIYGGQGIEMNIIARANALNGVHIDGSSVSEVHLTGDVYSNNRADNADGHGVYAESMGEGFSAGNLRSGNAVDASGNQRYGIKIGSGVGANWRVVGCGLKDNEAGPLLISTAANGTAVGNTPSDGTQDIINGSRLKIGGSSFKYSQNATVTAAGTLTPSFTINGGTLRVRDGTSGGTALFIIDAITGGAKIAGSAAIVAGAPGVSELGVSVTTGVVTNGYAVSHDVFIDYDAVQ